MSLEFDENLYWPHKWSKRLPEDVIRDRHLEIIQKETDKNKNLILSEKNVKYGNTESEVLDIYGKDLPPDAPWFVYIHGGYWIKFSKNQSAYGAYPLWKAGIRVCVPEYELAPKATMTQIVKQVQTMADYVLRRAEAEGSKAVWICGHSAGGHLAARLLDEQWLKTLTPERRNIFKGLYLLSGIYDLKPILKVSDVNDLLKMNEDEAAAQSPINTAADFKSKGLVNQKFKTAVIVGGDESPAFVQQSDEYCKILNRVGMDAKYNLMEDIDHFNIVENLKDESYSLTKEFIDDIAAER